MKWITETQVPYGYELLVNTPDFSVYSLYDFDMLVEHIQFSAVFVRHTRRATKRHAKMACKRFIMDALSEKIKQFKKDLKDGKAITV